MVMPRHRMLIARGRTRASSATQIIEWVNARTLAQRRMGGTSVGPNAGEVLKDAAR